MVFFLRLKNFDEAFKNFNYALEIMPNYADAKIIEA